jgi:hypothetical protein
MVKSAVNKLQPDPAGTVCKLPIAAFANVKVNSPLPSVNVPTVGMARYSHECRAPAGTRSATHKQ